MFYLSIGICNYICRLFCSKLTTVTEKDMAIALYEKYILVKLEFSIQNRINRKMMYRIKHCQIKFKKIGKPFV